MSKIGSLYHQFITVPGLFTNQNRKNQNGDPLEISYQSKKNYMDWLHYAANYFKEQGIRNIGEIGLAEIQGYADHLQKKGYSASTQHNYQRMMKKLKPGDTLFVKSIDRLGRNYDEILEQWRIITKEKQAAVVVLDMPLLDTRQGRDLTGTLIADIVLQLLSYVAQTEREFIHQRQAEGISAAKARGVHFGRLPMEPPPEYEEVYAKWYGGSLSARAAARKLSISHQTFLKWAKNNGRKSVP